MAPIQPLDVGHIGEPQVSLVHKRRRLKAMAGAFTGHAVPRDTVQFPVGSLLRHHP